MSIDITPEHNTARLGGTLAFLDAGPSPARLRIYGGARPASASDTPSSVMLAEIRLTKPAGVLTDVLTLTPEDAGLITASGSATWARLVNGAEQTAADMDCTDDTGAGPVKLAQVALLIGGSAALTSAVLG